MDRPKSDLKFLFLAALDREPGAKRQAYLDEACDGDADLRRRIEALLDAHDRADEVLGAEPAPANEGIVTLATTLGPNEGNSAGEPTLAGTIRASSPDATVDLAPASTVGGNPPRPARSNDLPTGTAVRYFGDYDVRKELGRGGMGVVYEARQVSLNRPVALKMIKAGVLADEADLRRFQNEAEAVALLDHAGIVPVYEVGDHNGQRYFSMKLVEGGNLGDRLEAFKTNPRAAATLLAEVAEAVHHAHMRGILHRDLKPANILVDAQGHPHVTDFGLAKRVESDIEMTASGAILGTPAYMSPEQANGHRGTITTATDVYGLGAIFYALLTGKGPFGGDSVMATIDAVRATPPERPSKLNARIPRDLETICLKCLEKDPRRRYASAHELAVDLKNWLESRPITARRVSTTERAYLWCRRRPAIAALAASVLLAVVGGTASVIVVQARANEALTAKNDELDRANTRVQARFELAREAIRAFKSGVEQDETLKEDRLKPLRDKLLGSARRFYDKLGELLQGQTDAASNAILAESYRELGDLIDKIGQKPESLAAYKKAVAIRRELAALPGAGSSERVELARVLNDQGWEARQLGDHAGSMAAHEEARDLAEPLVTVPGVSLAARRILGSAHQHLGEVLDATGKTLDALATFRRALEVREPLIHETAAVPNDRSDLASTHSWIGGMQERIGDAAAELSEYRKFQELMRTLVAESPSVAEYRRELAASHRLIGGLLHRTGDKTGAMTEYRKFHELMRMLVAESPAVADYRRELAVSHRLIGDLLESSGENEKGMDEHRKSQELLRTLVAENPSVAEFRWELAVSHKYIGILLNNTGDKTGAMAEQRKFQELMRGLVADSPDVADYRFELAMSYRYLGIVLQNNGERAVALEEHRKCEELMRTLVAECPKVMLYRRNLAISHEAITGLLVATGNSTGALEEHRKYQELYRAWAAESPTVPWYRDKLALSHSSIGDVLQVKGDFAGALAEYGKYQELYRALAAESPEAPPYRLAMAFGHWRIGVMLRLAHRPQESLRELEEGRVLLESLAERSPDVVDYQDLMAKNLASAGEALCDLGRREEACERYARVVAICEAISSTKHNAADRRSALLAVSFRLRLFRGLSKLAPLKLATGDAAGAAIDARRALSLYDGLPTRSPEELYKKGCCHAVLAAASGVDNSGISLEDGKAEAKRAVEIIGQAIDQGSRDANAIRTEAALDALRSRADFQALIKKLVSPAQPAPVGETTK